jgi:hypothetical protein
MANRYWVGGTGTWNTSDTTHWSAASGGSNGASVPTSVDDVFFDTLSNAGNYTATVSGTVSCRDLTLGDPSSGEFTFDEPTGLQNLLLYGNLNLNGSLAGMDFSYLGTITFSATDTGHSYNNGTFGHGFRAVFNGVGGEWTFNSTFNNGSAPITITAGTVLTNNRTVTCGTFTATGSTTRALTLGSSTLSCNNWSISSTGMTFSAGTSTIICSNFQGVEGFAGGGLTYNIVQVGLMTSEANNRFFLTGANTFATFTFAAGGIIKSSELVIGDNQTVSGTMTLTGATLLKRLLVYSNTQGTARTLTAATVSIGNTDFQDITGAGAGSWTGTSIGNALGNSGITFTGAVTRYWVANGGNWSDTAHWANSTGGAPGETVPLCHDTVVFDASSFSSGSQTISPDMHVLGAGINFTGITNTPALDFSSGVPKTIIFGAFTLVSGMTVAVGSAVGGETRSIDFRARSSVGITMAGKVYSGTANFRATSAATFTFSDAFSCGDLDFTFLSGTWAGSSALTVAGSLVLGSGMTRSFTGAMTFSATSAKTLTFNGKSLASAMTFDGVGGTWTAQDTWTVTSSVTLTNGAINTNSQTCGWGSFSSSNSNTRSLTLGTTTMTLSGFSGGVWSFATATNFTMSAASATLAFSIGSAAGRNMSAQGFSYGTIHATGSGSGSVTFNGNLTIGTLRTTTPPKTFIFNSTGTYSVGVFATNGTVGNLVTLTSSAQGAKFTTSSSAGIQSVDYCSIRDSFVTTPINRWYASNSTNAGGNDGWKFTAPPDLPQEVTKPQVYIV